MIIIRLDCMQVEFSICVYIIYKYLTENTGLEHLCM